MGSERLLDRVRRAVRARGYSRRTEQAYVYWIGEFVRFAGTGAGADGVPDPERIEAFLAWLAVERRLSAATTNQAASAVMFLYRQVLRRKVRALRQLVRPREPTRVPTVLSRDEVTAVLAQMRGVNALVARVLYGSGLRLLEALQLRVKDVDLDRQALRICEPKGGRGRAAVLPERVEGPLREHLRRVRVLHGKDLARGGGSVALPGALSRKLPTASTSWEWQWVFPARRRYRDAESGLWCRHHWHPSNVQRAVRRAARGVGLSKRVTCHTFRHSFATHLLDAGCDIRTVKELLGHRDVRTTMIYLHATKRGGVLGVRSPLDTL